MSENNVDVLAVMQAAAAECICRASVVKPSRHLAETQAGALMEARAAVAELIEALRQSDSLLREFCARNGTDMTQLVANSAALARVQGGG